MKLATFIHDGRTRVGVVEAEEIIDLAAVAPDLPDRMRDLLAAGPDALDAVRAAAAHATDSTRLEITGVHFEAPVPDPRKYLAVGLNYADHIAEMGRTPPDFPTLFNKQVTCVNGPFDPIQLPRASTALDYEGELAFVIGRRARHVPEERAAEVIAGYTIANDVSVRDWQARAPTLTLGKSWDTHGPLGPWLVTPDEVGDPHTLDLRTWVNGEQRQHSNTRHMIHNCFRIVAVLSTVFTLEPGDIISTGTPSGVAASFDPPRFLCAGDVVRIEVERIGAIENLVVPEPDDTPRIE